MSKYKRGTQSMLDAAKKDATLLPFDTVFICNDDRAWLRRGSNCIRKIVEDGYNQDDFDSVRFADINDANNFSHISSEYLLPVKKPKQEKWQNGTQEDLDIAKDGARLIPKKTYFMSKYGATYGKVVYRVDSAFNDSNFVLMLSGKDFSADFHTANDLEPINEE